MKPVTPPQDHRCTLCPAWGSFGFEWAELIGAKWVNVQHWYCGAHRADGAALHAKMRGAE